MVDPPAEKFEAADAVDLLRSAGWIEDRDIVTQGVSVTDVGGSHNVYRVAIGDDWRWILKRHQQPRGDFDGSFKRERQMYALAKDIAELAAVMPRFVGLLRDVIAIEAITGKTGWSISDSARSSMRRGLIVGLGALHRATWGTTGRSVPIAAVPWIFHAMDFDSPAFVWEEPAAGILHRVAGSTGAVAALRSAKSSWRTNCLIHGDAKLDNAMVPDDPSQSAVLVDWELGGLGDPTWDIAGLFLRDVYVSAEATPGRSWLEPLIDDLAADLSAYTDVLGRKLDVDKFVSYLAAWMVQSVVAAASSGSSQARELNPVLAAGVEMLVSPGDFSATLQARVGV